MAQEPVWRVGPTMRHIYNSLHQSLRLLQKSPGLYLDDESLRILKIQKNDLDLDDTDEFFECMREEVFANLRPSDPIEPFTVYEDVDNPDSDPPSNVFELERCAREIESWFFQLQRSRIAQDGHGCIWPNDAGFWIPRQLRKYEDLYQGSRMFPAVPWEVTRAKFNTSGKPHQIYHVWHGDEGKEGVILRSELEILIRTMKGRMTDAASCTHTVPVLLLSIRGSKARIMIAHINVTTMTLDVKCSKFEQFDGFEARVGEEDIEDRARPYDFNTKRDLFFRWLNPTCRGDTFLEDSRDAPEKVLRGPKGRKRLVLRDPSPSTSTESVQSLE